MNKLVLESEDEFFEFEIIAIRCPLRMHRFVFALNTEWEGVFERIDDWEFEHRNQWCKTPRCRAVHPTLDSRYFILENKYYHQSKVGVGLFEDQTGEEWSSQKLIPQLGSIDYFMLIFDSASRAEILRWIDQLKRVREVESAWHVEPSTTKGVEILIDFN